MQMQVNTNGIDFLSTNRVQTSKKLKEQLLLERFSRGDSDAFWQLWQQHRDYLYHRCLGWMEGNYNDAEDVLSLASLKAWDKLPEYAAKITNPRGWFTRLTHNLCVDIHRERYVKRMTTMEEIIAEEYEVLITNVEFPESAILRNELKLYLHHAVNALCERLRRVFILHYFHEYSYQDIAQLLKLSLDNVYKRIQEAPKFLQKGLSRYFSGLDNFVVDFARDSCEHVNESIYQSISFDNEMALGLKKAMNTENVNQIICYQVSATCLQKISQSWYHSHNLLEWS